jgi:hypothetical protein
MQFQIQASVMLHLEFEGDVEVYRRPIPSLGPSPILDVNLGLD